MTTRIVATGETDKALLDALLADLSGQGYDYAVEAASNEDTGRPIARQYLLLRREPTAFVFGTSTSNPEHVREEVLELQFYFSSPSSGAPFVVVPMVPAMEGVFFEQPGALRRRGLTGEKEAFLRYGKYAPKQALTDHLPELGYPSIGDFIASLDDEDLAELRRHPAIDTIRGFILTNAARKLERASA